jgi:hypothetical protein
MDVEVERSSPMILHSFTPAATSAVFSQFDRGRLADPEVIGDLLQHDPVVRSRATAIKSSRNS